ncbi:MFS transporter [Salipiger sp. P9]|uniref:MFS transporter n=1 Tax=Salipiger pentaromativorans TaxID=2943193 RepID=UPI0021571C2D|nr:MFS transporter [Salipiger pentaromativorans]MCR8546761.1 MFS transporter [Salipiger pentaromativorans]
MTGSMTLSATPAPQRRMVISICLAAMVLPMTFAGGAIATPDLGRDFDQSGALLFWVVNGFMLVFGALPLVAGALADRLGRRRVFRFGLTGFVISGLLLPLSPSLLIVDLLRGIQGLFAAATLAGGTALLAQIPEEERRRKAFSMIGATFGFGLAFGPVIAGLALEAGGWRAVFVLASALAAAALATGAGALPESRSPAALPFDIAGAALFASLLAALTAWAVLLPARGPADPLEIGLLALTGLCLLGFVRQEKRHAAPMFDLSLLDDPAFLGVQTLPVATCFGFVSLLVIVPLQLIGAGYSELEAGLISMALAAPVFLIPALLTRFPASDRRRLVTLGLGLAALGLVCLAFTPFAGPLPPLLLALAMIGGGIGLPWGLMDGLAVEIAPRDKAGVATGMFSTVRVASEGIVLALVSALYAGLIAALAGVPDETATAIVSGGTVAPALRPAVEAACRVLFLCLAALTLLSSAIISRRLRGK